MKRCNHCGMENNAICVNHSPVEVVDPLLTCAALGYHDFLRGAADPHCTRCGLMFSAFKSQAKAVAE